MNSLSARLTIWYALASTATALAIFGFGRYSLEKSYIDGIDQLNDKEFEEIRPRILDMEAQGSSQAAIDAIKNHTELDATLFFFQVGHSHDRVFFTSSNLAGHELPHIVHQQRRITISDPDLGELRVSEYRAGEYDVHIASSLSGWYSLSARLLKLGMVIIAMVFLASVGVGYGLSRLAMRPVASIRLAASRISANNLSERIEEPVTDDEIGGLVRLLNRMFDRLEAAFQQAQRFTGDASHELKTPLSLIRLNAEAMLGGEGLSDDGRRKLAEAQIEEVERLNRMINDLLVLAKADAGALPVKLEPVPIDAFVLDFGQDAQTLCEDQGISFHLENGSKAKAESDRIWVRHCLFNLLSNALRYSPAGGTIALKSADDGLFWILEMSDEGLGVEASKLERIFDRFYRGGGEKSDGKSSGLGLALCHSILLRHGGTATARNRSDRSGLIVELRFPLRSTGA